MARPSQNKSTAGGPHHPPQRAVVFDMDGLMVDSESRARQVWERVVAQFGYEMDDALYARMVGHRTGESARILLEHYSLPFTPEELAAYKTRLWEEVWSEGLPAMPGLMELVAALSERALPWAVATSSPRRYALAVLAQLGLREECRAVVGGDEVRSGKPAPDIYLLAAHRLGIRPQFCLALEDSVPGGRAVQAAGMTLIAVPDGTTTKADFHFAEHLFDSLHGVASQLDWLLAQLPADR